MMDIYIIINIIWHLIAMILVVYKVIKAKIYAYSFIILGISNIIFIIKKNKLQLVDTIVALMAISAFISMLFAINRDVAIFGTTNRYEGLIQILYYYTLFTLSTYAKNKDSIAKTIIITGLINAIYTILQVYNPFSFLKIIKLRSKYNNGFTTNSNFLGSYLLLSSGYSISLFIKEHKYYYLIAYLILLIGLYFSDALSALVGLIAIIIYLGYFLLKNKKAKELIIIFMIFIISLLLTSKLNLTSLAKDIKKTNHQVTEIVKGNIKDEMGTKRIFVWKNSLKIVPKYLLHGCGISNFLYAFGDEPLHYNKVKYDRAHNEYLNLIITEGLLSLVSYLALLGITITKSVINDNKNNELSLSLLSVIGYVVCAFFSIRTIEVAPIFFISLGLLVDRNKINV